jgi:hypothetical protein
MKTRFLLAGSTLLAIAGAASAQDTCDTILNTGSIEVTGGGISCAADNITTNNYFAKSYNLAALLPGQAFELSCVEFGVGNSGTDVPGTLTVYRDTNGGAPQGPGIDLVAIGNIDFTLGNAPDGIVQASFDPPLNLPADGVYVVELFLGASTDGFASIATNAGPDDATYIRTDDCGLATFVTYASIGFPDVYWAQQLIGDTVIDGAACDCYTGSDCFVPHVDPGCDDPICSQTVCGFDSFCCDVTWDDTCAAYAEIYCGFTGFECDFPATTGVENESCGGDTNGGCNMDVPAFDSIASGDFIAGTYQVDGVSGVRDTDWYQFTLDSTSVVDLTVWSRVAVDVFIVTNDCANLAIVAAGSGSCPSTLSACLLPGTYNAFVAPSTDGGNLPCDLVDYASYVINLEIESLPTCPGFDDCPGGDLLITPNSDLIPTEGGIACAGGGLTRDNTWAVSINLADGATSGSDVTISCVEFGAENSGSPVPARVQIWLDTDGGAPTAPDQDLQLLGTRETVVAAGALNMQRAAFDEPICIPADSQIVVTLSVDASTDGFAVFAANTLPSASPTYILSTACGLATFTDLAAIGFPNVNWVVDLEATLGCDSGSCEGDFNGDGQVNGADFGSVLAAWGPCAGCPEDLNGDGVVSGADVGLLLSVWGACP